MIDMKYPAGWEEAAQHAGTRPTPEQDAANARAAFAASAALSAQLAEPLALTPAHPERYEKRRKKGRKTAAKPSLVASPAPLDSIGTVAAAAAVLGVSEQMIRRYLASGELAGKPVGGWAIDLASLATLSEKRAEKRSVAS